ncbi:34878_t:CDS:2, partial [Racocetra persica]
LIDVGGSEENKLPDSIANRSVAGDDDWFERSRNLAYRDEEPLEPGIHGDNDPVLKGQAGERYEDLHVSRKGKERMSVVNPIEECSQHITGREKQRTEEMDAISVNAFLSALNKIERKMDHNFEVLQNQRSKETEQENQLDEAWPKIRLNKPRDQHEYDFLIGVGKRLDIAITRLLEHDRKELVMVRDDIEAPAVTLRLANDRGWKVALQVVGGNDRMMEKYKDQIGTATKMSSAESRPPMVDQRGERVIFPFVTEKPIGKVIHQGWSRVTTAEESATSPPTTDSMNIPPPWISFEMGLSEEAQKLVRSTCSENWNSRLDKAWKTYADFCRITKQCAVPSSEESLLSCLIWLDLTDAVSACTDVLAAVSREHLERSLPDPSKFYN